MNSFTLQSTDLRQRQSS